MTILVELDRFCGPFGRGLRAHVHSAPPAVFFETFMDEEARR